MLKVVEITTTHWAVQLLITMETECRLWYNITD